MAKESIVRLIDDIDGSEAESTVRFSWEGTQYEIDLSTKNSRAFSAAVEPFVKAATRVGAARRGRARSTSTAGKTNLSAVREWAAQNGHKVADRGRIPQLIVDAYQAAQSVVADVTAPAASARKAAPRAAAARRTPARKAPASKAPARKAAPRKRAAAS
jgi:hypothetical protein